jgi:hypothetical protein
MFKIGTTNLPKDKKPSLRIYTENKCVKYVVGLLNKTITNRKSN